MIKDLIETLYFLGLKQDDAVFIHSDMSNFRFFKPNMKTINEDIFKSILEVVGKNGAILVPTFTYHNFTKEKIFDNKNTFSETGIFSEFVRTQKNSLRSNHPIFSVASHGNKSELFVRNNSLNSTGAGSPFERLFHFNAKILHINLELVTRTTYLHYIEEKNNVPYRYSKYFEYLIVDHNNNKKKLFFENFVRKIETLKFPSTSKSIQKMLISNKITKSKRIKKNIITLTECQNLFNFVSNKMKKNKFILYQNSF